MKMDPDARARFVLHLDALDQATSQLELCGARCAAEGTARECGLTFDQAMKVLRSPPPSDDDDEAEEAEAVADMPPETDAAHLSSAIAAALAAGPARSDRDIAREIGCSPTTVGKVRAEAGLARDAREVRRGNQVYAMRLGDLSVEREASSTLDITL